MNNPQYLREQAPHILNWQIAYAARELRHNKTVTISCLKSEAGMVIEQLSQFSSPNPISMKTVNKPHSREVYLEIAEAI